MSTPKTIVDASTDLDEAVLNLFLRAGKLQVKVNYCRIDFDAGTNTPTIQGSTDSDGEIVTGDLSWDAGDTEIDIVLSGFTAVPVVMTTLTGNDSTNIGAVLGRTSSASLVHLRFIGVGAGQTAVDPDNDVRTHVFIIGV